MRLGGIHQDAGDGRDHRGPDRPQVSKSALAYVGNCISLGRKDAIFQAVDGDARSKSWSLRGRPAARVKSAIVLNRRLDHEPPDLRTAEPQAAGPPRRRALTRRSPNSVAHGHRRRGAFRGQPVPVGLARVPSARSAADAEDAVQDAFLRWHAADREHIEVPEAWLTKVVTNLALDRLRSAKMRRERAVGDWLPEPLLDGDPMLGPAETVEQRESVTLAVLILMERLTPVERAVYVLREAFSHRHAEIAAILDLTESASQQHAHRARRRIATERTGAEIDGGAARRVVEAFVAAAASGRPNGWWSCSPTTPRRSPTARGLSKKLLRYAVPERIAAVLRAGFKPTPAKRRLVGGTPAIHAAMVNGSPAMLVSARGPGRGGRDPGHPWRQDRRPSQRGRPCPTRSSHRGMAAARA